MDDLQQMINESREILDQRKRMAEGGNFYYKPNIYVNNTTTTTEQTKTNPDLFEVGAFVATVVAIFFGGKKLL